MTTTKLRPLVLIITGLLWLSFAQAQESVNASGGNATGSGGIVAYSIGQVVYTTNTGNTGSLAQGVQHGYEIFTVGINKSLLNVSLTAFPNPTGTILTIQIGDYNNEKLLYQLFDMNGKLFSSEQIDSKQTQINITSLPLANYLINILNQSNEIVQSFKIIKN
jgi:hypothetical protein